MRQRWSRHQSQKQSLLGYEVIWEHGDILVVAVIRSQSRRWKGGNPTRICSGPSPMRRGCPKPTRRDWWVLRIMMTSTVYKTIYAFLKCKGALCIGSWLSVLADSGRMCELTGSKSESPSPMGLERRFHRKMFLVVDGATNSYFVASAMSNALTNEWNSRF